MPSPKSAFLIFPHQLFEVLPSQAKDVDIFLVEEYLFFGQYNFHKAKLAFHRASMKKYEAYLLEKKLSVTYIAAQEDESDIRKLIPSLEKKGYTHLIYWDVVDDYLQKRISAGCEKYKLNHEKLSSDYFMNTAEYNADWQASHKTYFHHNFYIAQRKKYGLLMDGKEPTGGQWSYDHDNRKKFPKNGKLPSFPAVKQDEFCKEAVNYVEENFPDNYGDLKAVLYPTSFANAKDWLEEFLKIRFHSFGDYEDALLAEDHKLFHSLLSPLLNCGLLTPNYVIETSLKKAQELKIPINSVEGFIRQIISWREFIRLVYEHEGSKQRTKNDWGFTRKIPETFWTGDTGIEPVDNVIKEVLRTGYCHHIERLMVLGNFMLLCEFDPDEVYRWFMELFIDAYDWVMVPNVYGMSQFADGGLMTTKPYISGSNYILKMSNYKKGDWCGVWDSLFWRFMSTHRETFDANPRLRMLMGSYDKMDAEKKENLHKTAEKFLKTLDGTA